MQGNRAARGHFGVGRHRVAVVGVEADQADGRIRPVPIGGDLVQELDLL
jgi:hypothetical protein